MPATPRYTTAARVLDDAAVTRAAARWRADHEREIGSPLVNAIGLIVGMGVIGAGIGALPMLGGEPYAAAAPLGLAAFGALLSLLVLRRARQSSAAIQTRAAALRSAPPSTEVTLRLDGPHRFVPHEHGILVLVPLDATRCVVLDLLSIADDPRHAPVEAALADKAVPREWRWVETADGAILDFGMSGPAITPTIGEEGWELDDDATLARVTEAMPDRGHIAELDFAALVARAHGPPPA